jgi:hypothetical protein
MSCVAEGLVLYWDADDEVEEMLCVAEGLVGVREWRR